MLFLYILQRFIIHSATWIYQILFENFTFFIKSRRYSIIMTNPILCKTIISDRWVKYKYSASLKRSWGLLKKNIHICQTLKNDWAFCKCSFLPVLYSFILMTWIHFADRPAPFGVAPFARVSSESANYHRSLSRWPLTLCLKQRKKSSTGKKLNFA